MKLNKTEKKAIAIMVKTGFTFYGDNITPTYLGNKRAIDGIVRKGYAEKVENEYGTEFKPTEAARDFVTYGIEKNEII